jgi:threonine dehydrogenase-like Zn-dependent dehydrogenase
MKTIQGGLIRAMAKAAVFTRPRKQFDIREYPIVRPADDQILVDMETSGICGTDVHIYEGKIQLGIDEMILGHEAIGTVREVGTPSLTDACGNRLHVGDRVILMVAKPCNNCPRCLEGDYASCLNIGVTYFANPSTVPHFYGGFAEIIYHPACCAVKVSEDLGLTAAAAFACAGPTVLQALEYAGKIKPGARVLVQGSGPVGLFAAMLLTRLGAKVIMFGSSSHPLRLELACQYGAEQVFDIRNTTIQERGEAIRDFTNGIGIDLAFEASGNPEAMLEGLNLLRKRGEYVIPGQYSNRGTVPIPPDVITTKALRLIGSGQYAVRHVANYLDLLKQENVSDLAASAITHLFPLSSINEAFETVISGRCIKVLLKNV